MVEILTIEQSYSSHLQHKKMQKPGSSLRFFLDTFLCVMLLQVSSHSSSQAQVTPHYEQPIPTPLKIISRPDSLFRSFNEDSLIARSVSTSDTVVRSGKSTTIALLASMLIPGAGQLYNGSYWKAPLVWGLGYYLVSVYNQENTLFKRYKVDYAASIDSSHLSGDTEIKRFRDFYRGQRDTFGWYVAIAYIINILDAYVDASLYNFEVSPNLQSTADLRVNLKIPL